MDIHRLRSLLYQITHTGGELCRDVPVSSAHLSLMLAACPPSAFLTRLENRIEKRRKLLYSSSRMNTIQAAHTLLCVCVPERCWSGNKRIKYPSGRPGRLSRSAFKRQHGGGDPLPFGIPPQKDEFNQPK
jgi:hypothetical protein